MPFLTEKKQFGKYKLMLVLTWLCLIIIDQASCFDYEIPKIQILSSKTINTKYKINYLQQKQKKEGQKKQQQAIYRSSQDTVRVYLGTKQQQKIRNVYKAQVNQQREDTNDKKIYLEPTMDQRGNYFCNVLKVQTQGNSFEKYVLTYSLNQHKKADNIPNYRQFFINTVYHVQSNVFYYPDKRQNSMGGITISPQQSLIQQRTQQFVLYSITNTLQIHKTILNQNYSQLYISNQNSLFGMKTMINVDYYNTKSKKKQSIIYGKSGQNSIGNLCKQALSMLDELRPDNEKFLQLYQIDNHILIKCLNVNGDIANLLVYLVKFQQSTWTVQNDSKFEIEVRKAHNLQVYDSIQVKKLRGMSKQQADTLLIMSTKTVYSLSVSGGKLISQKLVIPISSQPTYLSMHPTHLKLSSNSRKTSINPSYLMLVEQNQGLLLVNIQNKNNIVIEMREKFNGSIAMTDIQYISYVPYHNFNLFATLQQSKRPIGSGVLEVVVIEGNTKQYIVEIFHQINSIDGSNAYKHGLHINKIYHNYHANTNRAQYFRDKYNRNRSKQSIQQQYRQEQRQIEKQIQQQYKQQSQLNINTIQKLIFPQTAHHQKSERCQAGQCFKNNNIGIVQSQHKIIFFQYGIPRTLSPYVTSQSQFIKEESYGIISDIDYVYLGQKQQSYQSRSPGFDTKKRIQQIKANTPNINTMINNKKLDELMRYIITLDNMVFVIQFDPINMYHYEYVCNINSYGALNNLHNVLHDVEVVMEQTCQQGTKDGSNQISKMGYCQERQIINFDINFWSIQDQKDWFWHGLIITIVITVILGHLFAIAIYWKSVKNQIEKLLRIRKERRSRLMNVSTQQKNQENHHKNKESSGYQNMRKQ